MIKMAFKIGSDRDTFEFRKSNGEILWQKNKILSRENFFANHELWPTKTNVSLRRVFVNVTSLFEVQILNFTF